MRGSHVFYYQPRACIRVSKRIHRTIDKDCGNCAFDKTRDDFWVLIGKLAVK